MRLQYFEQEFARLRDECEETLHSVGEADELSDFLSDMYESGQVSNEMLPTICALGIIQWVIIAEEFRQKEKMK